LHHPLVNTIIASVKEGIKRGKVPVYSPSTGSGILRYLVIRVSESGDQGMVIFVTARRSFNEIHHLGKYLQAAVPQVSVIAQNENSSSGNAIFGEKFHFLTKKQSITAHIGEISFSVSPRSFFQVNVDAARLIYDLAAQWGQLNGKQRVVDVYCGIGGISLFLAGKSAEVYGIEVVETAVSDALRNARANGIRNCRFEAGDAKELLAELREEQHKVDLLILNPPRKGCERQVLEEVAQLRPTRVIYVSCSPATLARDLNILSGLGYATLEIQPVDMFPHTQHVENVALMVKT
jgi:23S rRNA (uracil1939-C5)-methyltransferase